MYRFLALAAAATVAAGVLCASWARAQSYDFGGSNVPSGSFYYAPGYSEYSYDGSTAIVDPGMTFSGMSGVQANSSLWGFPTSPSGASAFIQSISVQPASPGSIGLAVSDLTVGRWYDLSLSIAARAEPFSYSESFGISMGNTTSGVYSPITTIGASVYNPVTSLTTWNDASWVTETVQFQYQGGTTLEFTGSNFQQNHPGTDAAIGIDNATVSPETGPLILYQYTFENSNVPYWGNPQIASCGVGPTCPTGSFYYAPGFTQYSYDNVGVATVPGVTFKGLSGVSTNGSLFNFRPVPNGGTYEAFIQSSSVSPTNPGEIDFDVSNLTSGRKYELSFFIAERDETYTAPETFTVSLGGDELGKFTPTTTGWVQEWVSFVDDGASTLDFVGAGGGIDADVGIADVTVATVPELPTWAMMIAGIAGLGLAGAKRRKRSLGTFD